MNSAIRRWIAAGAAAVVVALVAGVLWYRASGPRLETVQFGVGAVAHADEVVHIGVPVRATGGALTIDRLELIGLSSTDDLHVEWWILDGSKIGTARGDLADTAPHAEPAIHGRVDGEQRQLLLSLTSNAAGVYRFDGVRISYGSGLRARTTELPVAI